MLLGILTVWHVVQLDRRAAENLPAWQFVQVDALAPLYLPA